MARAKAARKEHRADDAIRLFSRALDLYQGAFLHFDESSWATSGRERLRSAYVVAVTELAASYEAKMRWEDAASCYAKALEADELADCTAAS